METNNHQIVDYSAVLEAQYGALGTPERAKFDKKSSLLSNLLDIYCLVC